MSVSRRIPKTIPTTRTRTRSIIFDNPTVKSDTVAPPPVRATDEQHDNVYLRILQSPLRRCLLTWQVLPKEMMVQLKVVRTSVSTSGNGLLFTPSSILHPRFSPPPPKGKGSWVLCYNSAISALQSKGSYKRISSARFPSSTTSKIHSQLARRVVQEFEMLGERTKSRTRLRGNGEMRRDPFRRILEEEWERGRKEGWASMEGREGMKLKAVVRLRLDEGDGDRFSELVPRDATATHDDSAFVPFYSLPPFFNSVILPLPLNSDSNSDSKILISQILTSIHSTTSLFARRSQPSPSPPNIAQMEEETVGYAIYAYEDAKESDVELLLVALWRCRLWCGEGWEGEIKRD